MRKSNTMTLRRNPSVQRLVRRSLCYFDFRGETLRRMNSPSAGIDSSKFPIFEINNLSNQILGQGDVVGKLHGAFSNLKACKIL
jgi:hypothetical protein